MNLFIDMGYQNDLKVYMHCFSAIDHAKITKRMHTHSEYDTEWSNRLNQWQEKGYFKYHQSEELIGSSATVIHLLQFLDLGGDRQQFIKELNNYLHDGNFDSGAYFITYKSHEQ